MPKAPKEMWLIENPELDEDDDYRCILSHDPDWSEVNEGYELVGHYMLFTDSEPGEEFENAAKPMMRHLAENYHPHVKVIIDNGHAEILEGQKSFITEEFIKD